MNSRLSNHLPSATLLLSICLISGAMPMAAEAESRTSGKPGYTKGGFHLLPELEVTGYYDDNIYATKRAKESDLVAVVSPTINMDSLWERHSLDLGAGAVIGRYLDNSTEDYEDFWFKGDAELKFTEASQIYGGAGYSYNHESRDSKESAQQAADELTTYDVRTLQVGIDQRWGQALLKFGTTYEALDYANVGSIFNDDRDRKVRGLGLRVSNPIANQTSLYLQGVFNQRRYDDALDQFGYDRDSEGYNAVVGLNHDYRGGNSIEVYVGYLEQEYDDGRFDRLSEPNYGFDLRWYPTSGTKMTGKLERSSNETTEVGSAGYLHTGFDLQLDHKVVTDLLGYLNFNYGLAEFQDVGREDVTQSVSVGVKYYMSPKVMITGSYSHIDNDSNDQNNVSPVNGTYDYTRNLFFITLRARLAP